MDRKKREYEKHTCMMSPLPVIFVGAILTISVLNMQGFIEGYNDAMDEYPDNRQQALSTVESRYISDFSGADNYVEINSLFSTIVDKKEVNERYKLNNGRLTNVMGTSTIGEDMADGIERFKEYLAEKGIGYSYVQVPFPYATDDEDVIPFGYESSYNQSRDNLIGWLRERSVNVLDLRENVVNDGLDFGGLYYKGDHHWTVPASLWAHEYVVKHVDELLNVNVANEYYFDTNNYIEEEIDSNIVGSHSNRTGVIYGGYDRIVKMLPIETQELRFEIPSRTVNRTGSFEEVFDNPHLFEDEVSYVVSGVYLIDNHEYKKITNYSVDNDLKVMLINDSFSLTLAPYLAQHFNEIHMYDIREEYNGSTEGLLEKIEEINPDIVLQVRVTASIIK